MTEQDLKKLSRRELLEMLVMQGEELESVKKQLANTKQRLLDKEMNINNAGSIAEAALKVNGVFEACQAACAQYTDNIKNLSDRTSKICEEKLQEAQKAADRIIAEATAQKEKMEKDTKIDCDMMLAKAKVDSEAYWKEVSTRLENFYKEYNALQKILPIKEQ